MAKTTRTNATATQTRTRNSQATAQATATAQTAETTFQTATKCNLVLFKNGDVQGFELYFDAKPNAKVLRTLRDARFCWHSVKKCWYARQNKATAKAVKAISKAFEPKAEASKADAPKDAPKASAKAQTKSEKKAQTKATAEPKALTVDERLDRLESLIGDLANVVLALSQK